MFLSLNSIVSTNTDSRYKFQEILEKMIRHIENCEIIKLAAVESGIDMNKCFTKIINILAIDIDNLSICTILAAVIMIIIINRFTMTKTSSPKKREADIQDAAFHLKEAQLALNKSVGNFHDLAVKIVNLLNAVINLVKGISTKKVEGSDSEKFVIDAGLKSKALEVLNSFISSIFGVLVGILEILLHLAKAAYAKSLELKSNEGRSSDTAGSGSNEGGSRATAGSGLRAMFTPTPKVPVFVFGGMKETSGYIDTNVTDAKKYLSLVTATCGRADAQDASSLGPWQLRLLALMMYNLTNVCKAEEEFSRGTISARRFARFQDSGPTSSVNKSIVGGMKPEFAKSMQDLMQAILANMPSGGQVDVSCWNAGALADFATRKAVILYSCDKMAQLLMNNQSDGKDDETKAIETAACWLITSVNSYYNNVTSDISDKLVNNPLRSNIGYEQGEPMIGNRFSYVSIEVADQKQWGALDLTSLHKQAIDKLSASVLSDAQGSSAHRSLYPSALTDPTRT